MLYGVAVWITPILTPVDPGGPNPSAAPTERMGIDHRRADNGHIEPAHHAPTGPGCRTSAPCMLTMVQVLWRCLLVSLLVSVLGPAFMMTLMVGEEAVDLSGTTAEELQSASTEELGELIQEEARPVTGIVDRFRIVFSHPQIAWFYFDAAVSMFCLVFPATLVASLWSVRGSSQ